MQRFASPADEPWFRAAFPADQQPVSLANIVRAIAAFERTLVSADSPFDRYLYRDDRTAVGPEAIRGMKLFFSERVGCSSCHAGFNLSGPVTFSSAPTPVLRFTNTGLYDLDGKGAYPAVDRGLMDKTRSPADMGRFRAPTLRNIALTAPYMHDGSIPTLDGVIAHYAAGGKGPLRSPEIKGFAISPSESGDLVAFLESLTDTTFVSNPAFANPRRQVGAQGRASARDPSAAADPGRYTVAMPKADVFPETFRTLRAILEKHRGKMIVTADTPTDYSLASADDDGSVGASAVRRCGANQEDLRQLPLHADLRGPGAARNALARHCANGCRGRPASISPPSMPARRARAVGS